MDPAFSIQRLEKNLSQFYEISTSFCDAVQSAVQESSGKPIDVKKILSPFNVGQCLDVTSLNYCNIMHFKVLFKIFHHNLVMEP